MSFNNKLALNHNYKISPSSMLTLRKRSEPFNALVISSFSLSVAAMRDVGVSVHAKVHYGQTTAVDNGLLGNCNRPITPHSPKPPHVPVGARLKCEGTVVLYYSHAPKFNVKELLLHNSMCFLSWVSIHTKIDLAPNHTVTEKTIIILWYKYNTCTPVVQARQVYTPGSVL